MGQVSLLFLSLSASAWDVPLLGIPFLSHSTSSDSPILQAPPLSYLQGAAWPAHSSPPLEVLGSVPTS